MEPNVKKGNGIKRRRRLGTKRVPRQSKFAFRYHAQSMRERERNRTQSQPDIRMEEYVCMKYA